VPLPRSFFARPTLEVARGLLGKTLVRLLDGHRAAGVVSETEAYVGAEDLGCHARAGRTQRNASLWGPPGHAYVYFTYGMHWLLNAVTEAEGSPAAVLLRGIVPLEGLEVMARRRGGRSGASLTDGPAKLCQALGIDGALDGADLCAAESVVFFEDSPEVPEFRIATGPRVGLHSVPEPWKSMPWRFLVVPEKHRSR